MSINTSSIPNASAPFDPTGSTGSANGSSPLGKESFMKLLVTQLSAQDPLNPADSAEFVSQLTQFTSMEQLMNIKEGLDLLAITQTAGTSAEMVSFIGKEVAFNADSMVLDKAGDTAKMEFDLSENAESVDIVVKNEAGEVVRTIQDGAMGKGKQIHTFNGLNDDGGKLPEGTYTFEVVAKDKNGDRIDTTSHSQGVVEAVVFEQGYPELLMEDGRKVILSQVIRVVNPEDSPQLSTASAGPTASQLASMMTQMETELPGDINEERGLF